MAIAQAKERAGDREGAKAAYTKVTELGTGLMRGLALLAIGDLDNPLAHDGGDAAAAKEAYTRAKAELPPRPAATPGDLLGAAFGTPYTHAEIESRLALLN